MSAREWLAGRLDPSDHRRWARLGVRTADLETVRALTAAALDDEATAARVRQLAARVEARIGDYTDPEATVFGSAEDEALEVCIDRQPVQVLGGRAILALAATADQVVAHHRARGITTEQSWRTLSDLGQQMWVHRQTFGAAGLHTHPWLLVAWSGALHWLGRLQFNLHRYPPGGTAATEWVLSTHIPQAGPLDPAAVQASLDASVRFFTAYYPDHPVRAWHCMSWLLDPRLAGLTGSNVAAFQRRWQLTGEGLDGNADALFFVFRVRGDVDPATLPRQTGLQRLVLTAVTGAEPWRVLTGLIPMPPR